MSIRISTDKHELDLALIHGFLHDHAYWSLGIPIETVETAIHHSLCFGVYLEEQQIGFARLVTDHVTFGYLCDVFILPTHRSRGYAKQLVEYIFAVPELQLLRRIVLVTSDAHELYRPVGFAPLAKPEGYMELHRVGIYKR